MDNFGSKWGKEKESDFVDLGKNIAEKSGEVAAKINFVSHWIFWILIAFAAIGAVFAGFYFFNYFSASREISLVASGPHNVLTGVPFDLSVDFNNSSQKVLQNTKLSVFLPEGTIALGVNKEKRVFEKERGDINPDSGFSEKIKMLIFNGGESVKKFDISVSYDSSLGTAFEKKYSVEVSSREPAIKIDLAAPEKVLNNEEFETIIKYSNISEFDFSGVNLNFSLPNNFIVKSFNPAASAQAVSGNVLKIGDLKRNQNGELVITGKISGAIQPFFEITSGADALYDSQIFKVSEKTAKVNIAPSPLLMKIESDTVAGYVSPSNNIKFRITYLNNSDVSLADIVIKAKLSGGMFDFSKLRTNAAYSSRDNTLVWNAASNPELRLVESGGGGIIEFDIDAKQGYPIKRLSDKNFVLKVAGEISSPTVPYYVSADKTISFANWEAKVAGAVGIETKAYATNKSSLPPKADKPINFTVHWLIRNYATDIREVNVGAFLGPGVKLVGQPKSNIGAVPAYNDRTQEIRWAIDKIMATKGVISSPIEAIFQIELTPNANQIGDYPILIGETSISAIDEFVNANLANVAKGLTTRELSDAGFDSRSGEVIQ
ncbi:MAG: hypothetical protein M1170_02395 [Patescibacteria group bacterium]|nr:hypothetical protein [Patescibacteria group bacterium]